MHRDRPAHRDIATCECAITVQVAQHRTGLAIEHGHSHRGAHTRGRALRRGPGDVDQVRDVIGGDGQAAGIDGDTGLNLGQGVVAHIQSDARTVDHGATAAAP